MASAPSAATSTATTTIPASLARFTAGPMPFGIGGIENDHVDFGGNKVIDLSYLLAQIVAAGDQCNFDFIACQFACFQLRAFGDLHEERVRQIAHRDADGFQIFGLRKGALASRAPAQSAVTRGLRRML